jgi:hypothetical protein
MARTGQLFGLGLNMGMAEVQTAIAMGEKSNLDRMLAALNAAAGSLALAANGESAINQTPPSPGLDVNGLYLFTKSVEDFVTRVQGTLKAKASDYTSDTTAFYNNLVSLRTAIAGTLAKTPGDASLNNAFNLGLDLGMAEASASAGADPDTTELYLSHAQSFIKPLGLPMAPWFTAEDDVELPTLYTDLVALRTQYQTALGN